MRATKTPTTLMSRATTAMVTASIISGALPIYIRSCSPRPVTSARCGPTRSPPRAQGQRGREADGEHHQERPRVEVHPDPSDATSGPWFDHGHSSIKGGEPTADPLARIVEIGRAA